MNALKHAFRNLTRTPFIVAIAVLSLALGIGANAAIFSLLDQMLLRSLPVQDPERLVNLSAPGPKPGSQSCNQAGSCDDVFSYAMFRDLEKADQSSFSGVAGHVLFDANFATGDRTLSGQGALISGGYFPLLGVQPALGRLIAPADDVNPGQHSVVVLSNRFWRSELGADPDILGRPLSVNGQILTVIGVAPRGFNGTTFVSRPDVFIPLSMRAAIESYFDTESFDDRRSYWAYVFGRLAPGVSMEQAEAELGGIYSAIVNEVEVPLQEGMSDQTMEQFRAKKLGLSEGRRGQSSIHDRAKTPLVLLFSITGVVLLIACGNIANLLLARGATRAQEMAVRSSLGAGRARLLAQLLTESALLALFGGLASVVIARWTLSFVGSLLPAEMGNAVHLELNPAILLFAAGLSLVTGVFFGMYPALHATRPNLVNALKSGTSQSSGARAAARFRSSLVTAQIALSMTLLLAAGLFVRSLMNVSRVDLGLEQSHLVTFTIAPALSGYEPENSLALFERVEEELAAIPGVSSVTGASIPILTGRSSVSGVSVEGFERGPDTNANAGFNEIGPDYFKTLGVPLLAGREFTTADTEGGLKVAIVNEAFAEKFHLDSREAVGKWMTVGGIEDELDTQIIGVVQNAKYADVKDEFWPLYFRPYRQDLSYGLLTFYARTKIDPDQVMAAIPPLVKRLDPNLPVQELKTLKQQVKENVFLDRVITTLSAAFAVLATLLAAVGLYGVLAYSVAQRTREIGVRMALGAGSGNVLRMVLQQMGRMFIIGGTVGVVAALAAGRAARSLLFGLEGADPVVMAVGILVLGLVTLAAGFMPARRASQVDPMQALRHE